MNKLFYELQGSSKYDIHDGPEESMAVIKLIGDQLQSLDNMYDVCVTSQIRLFIYVYVSNRTTTNGVVGGLKTMRELNI